MRNEWVHYTLDDIVKINSQSYKNNLDWEFINYLDTGNVTENIVKGFDYLVKGIDKVPSRAKRRVRPGDILYSTVRPNQRHYGILKHIPQNTLASTGFAVIEVDKNFADNHFIFYFLTQNTITNYLQVLAESSTSTYPSIKPGDLKALEINLPPLPEQKAIAHILGTLDDKIELNRQMNETLEQMAQALFQSWFVDFDPVIDNALDAGNPIPEPLQKRAQRRKELGERRRPLPAHIAAAFPDRFVFTEEMGWIPEGWEVNKAENIFNISIGKTPPRKEEQWFSRNPSDVKWISIKDMGGASTYLNESSEYLTKEAVEKFNIQILPKYSVFVSFKLTVGRVGIAADNLTSNEAIAHFPPVEEINANYTYFYLKSIDYNSLGSTSSIATAVNSKTIKGINFLVPKLDLLSTFDKVVSGQMAALLQGIYENVTLTNLRDTLLPKLISGELRVPDAEKLVAEYV